VVSQVPIYTLTGSTLKFVVTTLVRIATLVMVVVVVVLEAAVIPTKIPTLVIKWIRGKN
jgi:hypothetical protein